jgi:hypothetical protein
MGEQSMKEAGQLAQGASAAPRWTSVPLAAYAAGLPLVRRRILLKATDDLVLPAFRGALWHSVLGLALKTRVCTVPPGLCPGCRRRPECAYPRLMEAQSPAAANGPLGRGARIAVDDHQKARNSRPACAAPGWVAGRRELR